MSFIKLDEKHQNRVDAAYGRENDLIEFIDVLEEMCGKQRWFSIGRTHIEQGFMALRKGIAEAYKAKAEANAPTQDIVNL